MRGRREASALPSAPSLGHRWQWKRRRMEVAAAAEVDDEAGGGPGGGACSWVW